MQMSNGNHCPLLDKECIGLKCAWLTKIRGVDKNTGREIDDYQCAVAWMPVLLVENSHQQMQTGAAVESFRNEMVKANSATQKALIASAQKDNFLEY